MSERSGFFNALKVNGVPDRTYNADDYCDNLAVVISNGVLRSTNNDLRVTATGLFPKVNVGRAWIEGHYYYNDAEFTFPAVSVPISGQRYDRVILRLDKTLTGRTIRLMYLEGVAAANPAKPAITRNDNIYDLVLADILISANASTINVTDTRSNKNLCGWVYSTSGDDSFYTSLDQDFNDWFDETKDTLASVTLFKRYDWITNLTATAKTVKFNIAQYDPENSFIEVYVNGASVHEGTDFTLNATDSIITFSNNLVANTEIIVKAYKSIDGTGILTVADEITELQNRVAEINNVSQFNYICKNSNDNIALSQIAQAIYAGSYDVTKVNEAAAEFLEKLGGNEWLGNLPSDCNVTINVIGRCGVSTPFAGDGSSTSRYKYFSLGVDEIGDKKVTFDFAQCERMLIYCETNTDNIIFYGTDLNVKNVKVDARCMAANCQIQMIAGRYNTGDINFNDCEFKIITTGKAVIAENGNFTNCNCYGSSSGSHALLFVPTTDSLIRIFGGTHYAYTASGSSTSAVFYTYATAANGVIMAYNINCPTVTNAGFVQTNLSVGYAGKTYINGVVSTLASTGGYNEITGVIAKSKR